MSSSTWSHLALLNNGPNGVSIHLHHFPFHDHVIQIQVITAQIPYSEKRVPCPNDSDEFDEFGDIYNEAEDIVIDGLNPSKARKIFAGARNKISTRTSSPHLHNTARNQRLSPRKQRSSYSIYLSKFIHRVPALDIYTSYTLYSITPSKTPHVSHPSRLSQRLESYRNRSDGL